MMSNTDYYQKLIYIPQVDKNDHLLGKVERWEAHRKGILHRGLTAILKVSNQIVLQKRKHPVFDCFWDISFSSHPIFINDQLQDNKEAVLMTLNREWFIYDLIKKEEIIYLDKLYYQARDDQSGLIEHEIDYLYLLNLKSIPRFNENFAYEIKLIDVDLFKNKEKLTSFFKSYNLAPWVDIDHFQRLLT